MVQYKVGDLIEAAVKGQLPRPCVIPHVCNNQGIWGAGFVVPLKNAFPRAFESYKKSIRQLGSTSWCEVKPGLWIANMVAQTLAQERPLWYEALVECMKEVGLTALEYGYSICCPRFGAGLAGGKWEVIEELILDIWIRRGIPVQVWSLPCATD